LDIFSGLLELIKCFKFYHKLTDLAYNSKEWLTCQVVLGLLLWYLIYFFVIVTFVNTSIEQKLRVLQLPRRRDLRFAPTKHQG